MYTDILILGSGAAGIRAAISAGEAGGEVLLVTPGKITESGSTFSKIATGWGIQALMAEERTDQRLKHFFEDITRVGLGRQDPMLARILVEESGPRLEDLISYGIAFQRDDSGDFRRAKGCFSDTKRAYITADFNNIRQSFLSILRQRCVRIVTGYTLDLIMADGECWGAWILNNSGELIKLSAKATVLATGGGAGIYQHHLVDDDQVGDGYALAYRAGVELTNLEFIQFMLGLKGNGKRKFLPLGQLKEPQTIQDAAGKDLLEAACQDRRSRVEAIKKRQTHMPFSCRDASGRIDVAIARAALNGEKTYWQINGANGHRPEVVHYAQAFNGGVKINAKAETTLAGLFAAGEVAAGPHGADRIGGCMLTATQVFGRRAGHYAALRALKIKKGFNPGRHPSADLNGKGQRFQKPVSPKISNIVKQVKRVMSEHAAVVRTEEGLKNCLRTLVDYNSQLDAIKSVDISERKKYIQAQHMTTTARLVVESALLRKDCCGSHYREDACYDSC